MALPFPAAGFCDGAGADVGAGVVLMFVCYGVVIRCTFFGSLYVVCPFLRTVKCIDFGLTLVTVALSPFRHLTPPVRNKQSHRLLRLS